MLLSKNIYISIFIMLQGDKIMDKATQKEINDLNFEVRLLTLLLKDIEPYLSKLVRFMEQGESYSESESKMIRKGLLKIISKMKKLISFQEYEKKQLYYDMANYKTFISNTGEKKQHFEADVRFQQLLQNRTLTVEKVVERYFAFFRMNKSNRRLIWNQTQDFTAFIGSLIRSLEYSKREIEFRIKTLQKN
jgi:hypothetical protein